MREEWNFVFIKKRNSICDILSLGWCGYISSRCRWPIGNWICGLSLLLSSGLIVGLGERRKDCRDKKFSICNT